MHLAIVTPFPPTVTGIGQYGYHISAALARTSAFRRITVLSEMTPGAGALQAVNGLTVERVWRSNRADAGWKIARRLQRLEPDLVWFNLGFSAFGRSPLANISGLLSPLAAKGIGLRQVVTLHELLEAADLRELNAPGGALTGWVVRFFMALLVGHADVLCVTLKQHATSLTAGWPHRHVVHIPIGAADAPEVLAQPEDPELLFFASQAPFKGLELLLDAFAELRAEYPALRLTVAGAEHPRFPGYVRRTRSAYRDNPGVRWLGYVPESGLRDVFARATIVVLPYAVATGASSVLYRAATWGRPIVVSDLPKLRATVEEVGLQALFFRGADRSDLVATVRRLLSTPAMQAHQASHNLSVMRRMTSDETCRAYMTAFDLALSAGPDYLRPPLILHQSARR